jgi:hypothetical protein
VRLDRLEKTAVEIEVNLPIAYDKLIVIGEAIICGCLAV